MTEGGEFEFIAGNSALCFVDTFGDRGGSGKERLPDPESLRRWLVAAELVGNPAFVLDADELQRARSLREAVFRCARNIINEVPVEVEDVDELNRAARQSPLRPQWVEGELQQVAEHPLEAALSTLAADALHLIASPERDRIRRCPGCSMVFLDNSRPGTRRWCSSARGCGNREKLRRRRARRVHQSGERACDG